jgi:hypothetical protein
VKQTKSRTPVFILLTIILLIVFLFVGYYLGTKYQKVPDFPKQQKEIITSESKMSVNTNTPLSIVENYYNWYLDCIKNHFKNLTGKSPAQDCPINKDGVLTPALTSYLDSRPSYDPVLCAQNVPMKISFEKSSNDSPDNPSVLVRMYWGETKPNDILVGLTNVDNAWKISSINCDPGDMTQKGAGLENITYTLPPGWKAEIRNNHLILSSDGNGFFSIQVSHYPQNTGRREYYCQLVKYCTKDTYFNQMDIGNIAGYKALALDNSGGGADYFGAKGDKFYIIHSFSPPSPSELEKRDQRTVLDTLKF